MPYIWSMERFLRKGSRRLPLKREFEKIHQEAGASMLTRQLQRRLGTIPDRARKKSPRPNLLPWRNGAFIFVDAKSLDDVFSEKCNTRVMSPSLKKTGSNQ